MEPAPEIMDETAAPASIAAEIEDRARALVMRLGQRARKWEARKKHIEDRWLEDLRQYHGQHDPTTRSKLDELRRSQRPRSEAFVNVTRPKTNAMSARLIDMLFPTDERCWAIAPTPVPELTQEAEAAATEARKARKEARKAREQAKEGEASDADVEAAEAKAAAIDEHNNRIKAALDEAALRAEAMEREVHDQLTECRFTASARDIIDDACRIGAGVAEGPVMNDRVGRRWQKRQAEGGAEIYELLGASGGAKPAVRWVDPWSFFPDPDARTLDEANGCFVRHLETKRTLRRMAKLPGVNRDALRDLVERGPQDKAPSYLQELRQIGERDDAADGDRYCVWRYVGPLEAEDIETLAMSAGDDQMAAMAAEVDPLDEINVVMLFCDGRLLRIDPHPLDSGECVFSIFTLEKDEASVWGYGIPYIIRSEQRILNAAWRAMMDNAGIAAGPQVLRRKSVQTQDGTNAVVPWQVWEIDDANMPPGGEGGPPLAFIQPDMNQEQLANIIVMARQQIDDVTSMPMIQQGEQDPQTTKTVGGMAMLMSSGNVIYRRIVRNWDDDLMLPVIRRMYDWNMQHSAKDEIKGDYQCVARGSSVLLVRELQSQNLMWLMSNFGDDPDFDLPEIKRAFVRSLLMGADMFVHSPEQRDEALEQMREEQGPSDAEIRMKEMEIRQAEIDAKVAMSAQEWDTRERIAQLQFDAQMASAAARANTELDKAEARASDARDALLSQERRMAVEARFKQATGDSAGGNI